MSAMMLATAMSGCGKEEAKPDAIESQETTVQESVMSQVEVTTEENIALEEEKNEVVENSKPQPYIYNPYKLEDAIEGQVFETEFDNFGKVTFAPFWKEDQSLVITLQKDGQNCYNQKFDLLYGRGDNVTNELTMVSFEDVNEDQKNDIVFTVKTTSYWEHSDQTFINYETFILTQDLENMNFVVDDELKRVINWYGDNSTIEKIRRILSEFRDTEYQEVTILTDDEVRSMSYEEKMNAFLEGKVKVTRKPSLLEGYKNSSIINKLSKPVTLHDLMKGYTEGYMEDSDYPNIKPQVVSEYYTAKNRRYLFVSVGSPLQNDQFCDEYLIGEVDGLLQIVYQDESWCRSWQSYYDGIVIVGGGSLGATHHAGVNIGLNDEGDEEMISSYEEQTIREWARDYEYEHSVESNISDLLGEDYIFDDYYNDYYDDVFMYRLELGDTFYWNIEDRNYEEDKDKNQKKHDEMIKALEQSNLLEGGRIVSDEELEKLHKERFAKMGYPWVFDKE